MGLERYCLLSKIALFSTPDSICTITRCIGENGGERIVLPFLLESGVQNCVGIYRLIIFDVLTRSAFRADMHYPRLNL